MRPVGLATVLALGFGVVIGLGVGWAISIVESLSQESLQFNDSLCFRADGTPLIVRHKYGYVEEEYYTVDHQEITLKKNERISYLPQTTLVDPDNRWNLKRVWFPLEVVSRVRGTIDRRATPVYWYFLHNGRREGRGYFAGFDGVTKRCIGYIGRKGLQPARPLPDEQFQVDGMQFKLSATFFREMMECRYHYYWYDEGIREGDFPPWIVVMIAGGRLEEVDLREGTVRKFGNVVDPLSIGEHIWYEPSREQPPSRGREEVHQDVAVRMKDRILLLGPAGKLRKSYVIPERLRSVGSFNFYELPNQEAALVHTNRGMEKWNPQNHTWSDTQEVITWIDAQGEVLREKDVHLEGTYHPRDPRVMAWQLSCAVPAPLGQAIFTAGMATDLDQRYFDEYPTYGQALVKAIGFTWLPFVCWSLVSLALAAWCYRRQRRYAQPGAATWAVFVFLFGPAGLLAYRFHRRWPVLEACPACGKAVPRDRIVCAACNIGFPPPPRKGTEIFSGSPQ